MFKQVLIFTLLATVHATAQSTSANLVNTINVLNESGLACNQPADCGAVAIGNRACGGPETYIVVSKFNPHLESIFVLAKETVAVDKKRNRESGLAGICTIELAPRVSCNQNKCVGQQ